MKRGYRIFQLFFLLALSLSCCRLPGSAPSNSTGSSPSDPAGGGASSGRADSLFVESSGTGSRSFDFSTSDPSYITQSGYSLWALNSAVQNPFAGRLVTVNKLEGDATAGYGILFCHQDAQPDGSLEKMLIVLINTKGEYAIGEAVGSSFSYIKVWKSSLNLKLGYNQANTIGLGLSGRDFILSFNRVEVSRFTPNESSYRLSGADGYIAVISPQDDFPSRPVHISYSEQP